MDYIRDHYDLGQNYQHIAKTMLVQGEQIYVVINHKSQKKKQF